MSFYYGDMKDTPYRKKVRGIFLIIFAVRKEGAFCFFLDLFFTDTLVRRLGFSFHQILSLSAQ